MTLIRFVVALALRRAGQRDEQARHLRRGSGAPPVLISHILDREGRESTRPPGQRETSAVSRTASSFVATYSPREASWRLQMNDPHGEAGTATFAASHDGAGDDVPLLRRIGRGDEDAMAAFYREHGRVVLAQVLLVAGERRARRGDLAGHDARRLARCGVFPGRVVGAVLGDRHRPATDPGSAARPPAAG